MRTIGRPLVGDALDDGLAQLRARGPGEQRLEIFALVAGTTILRQIVHGADAQLGGNRRLLREATERRSCRGTLVLGE